MIHSRYEISEKGDFLLSNSKQENVEKKQKNIKITYRTKEGLTCPLCSHCHYREDVLSGGGRLVAGDLTDELHRSYEKTKKYGTVYPLIYNIVVCPKCFFTAFLLDFANSTLKNNKKIDLLKKQFLEHKELVNSLFPTMNFSINRTLIEGAAGYMLGVFSYEVFGHSQAPSLRKGMCALRAAWLLGYLNVEFPMQNYDKLQQLLYKKAAFYYRLAVELDEKQKEGLQHIGYLGPDTDRNYGFDGVQYLAALLEFKYGIKTDPVIRYKIIKSIRKVLSKVVGMGKVSHAKPGPVLELSREVYERVKLECNQLVSHGVEE